MDHDSVTVPTGPVLQIHTQFQAMRGQNLFNLVQGFLAQIRGFQELNFCAAYQITNIINVFRLETVGTAYSQFQIIDRAQQYRINLYLFLIFSFNFGRFQIDENRNLLMQNSRRLANGLFRIDRTIGFNIDNQFIQISMLLDPCSLNTICNTFDGTKRRIYAQYIRSMSSRINFLCCHAIPAPLLDHNGHAERNILGQMCNDMIRITNFNIRRRTKITGFDFSRLVNGQTHLGAFALVQN